MSKRLGGSNFFKSHETKKAKLEVTNNASPTDDVWGEDFDADELEECILRSTQLDQQNQSVCVPSYNGFQKKDQMIASTYKSDFAVPSTSKPAGNQSPMAVPNKTNIPKVATSINVLTNSSRLTFKRTSSTDNLNATQTVICNNEAKNVPNQLLKEIERLKAENKKISDKYITKEGEVTILRNQLKQTQKTIDNIRVEKMQSIEKQKNEWSDKVIALNNSLNSAKSELEIKNVEMLTLRNRCKTLESATIKKMGLLSQSQTENGRRDDFSARFNSSFAVNTPTKKVAPSSTKFVQTEKLLKVAQIDVFTTYPLRRELPEDIFKLKLHARSFKDSISPSFQLKGVGDVNLGSKINIDKSVPKIENKTIFSLEYVFPELNKLINLSVEELESDKNHLHLNKIIFACQQLLIDISSSIKNEKKSSRHNCIHLNERNYVKSIPTSTDLFNSRSICENELGTIIRQYLMILAIIIRYNSYLANYVTGSSSLRDIDDPEISEIAKKFKGSHVFLKIVKDVISKIREYDCTEHYCGLEIGVLELLTNGVQKSQLDTSCANLIFDIVKNIIFSCPPYPVLYSTIKLFETYSFNKNFTQALCCNASKDKFFRNESKIYFEEESCLLQHCSVQVDNALHKDVTDLWITIKQVKSLIIFFHNQYLAFNWASLKENKECQCTLNSMKCFFKFLNCAINYYKNYKYCFQERSTQTYLSNVFKKAVIMLHIFSYNKDVEMYKLFKLHRQNVHVLIELSREFEFERDLINILEELEADNDYQVALNNNEIFDAEQADGISNQLFDHFLNFV